MQINLPEWQDADFRLIREAEKTVVSIARGAGKGSGKFKDSCRMLLNASMHGNTQTLSASITSCIDVRAFTFLLASSDDFARRISLNRGLLDVLLVPRMPISKLSLVQLIRAYFVRYDTVAEKEALKHWQGFIQGQLNQLGLNSGTSDLSSYVKYSSILFSSSGPADVVAFAKKRDLDFDRALNILGLTGFSAGRFLTLCRYQYYLDTLKTIPAGSEHQILYEIVKKDVVNAPFDGNRLLGHAILEVLIDRSEGQSISQAWQGSILTIAGDPRVPKSSSNYQQWWTLLGEKRIALMRGWLSRFDLALFLRVLEQSAKDGSNTDMERMFESRKRFMEGLLEQGIVIHSRLFLSRYAEHYLKSHYKKDELPEYALVASQQTSMIYLNLSGNVHMIEGSHSFKLKLLDRLPTGTNILDYGVKVVSDSDLRTGILNRYYREFKNVDGYRDLTHDVHLGWQNKAIQFIVGHGIAVNPCDLIGKNRYREYKSKFGA